MARFDVVVCGLGIMGSAALQALARRGVRVLGIDRFAPGHDRGSSHGETRIIRLSYFEHPSYVPLLRHCYELWRDLERVAGQPLLHITGIVEIGPPEGVLIPGTLAASRLHGIPHQLLDALQLRRRYPAFRPGPDHVAVWQPDGGFIEAEPALRTLQALARNHGAAIRREHAVHAIEPDGAGVRVVTGDAVIEAGAAIVAAGPWLGSLLPRARLPLRVTRQVMGWFAPTEPFPRGFPVFLMESEHGIHYGFPPSATGIKAAKHHHADETVVAESYDRTVSAADEALIRSALAAHLPTANGALLAAKTCLYTMAPDGDFIIDRLPGEPSILIASPCSGHGFKFAPAIGEILADLVSTGATSHDISRFSIGRFLSGPGAEKIADAGSGTG